MKGRVVDESGNGLQGATVSEKGRTNNSTSTAADGGFTLNVQSPEAVLVVSYVGLQSNEIVAKGASTNMVVRLTSLNNSLQDVMVVGYGTQKKKTLRLL